MNPISGSTLGSFPNVQIWICSQCWRTVPKRSTAHMGSQNSSKPKSRPVKPMGRIGHGIRNYHSSHSFRDAVSTRSQAVPLGDFYTDLLSKPIPKTSKAQSSLPTFVQSGDKSKEERAKLLFGSIEGSGYERRSRERPDATWRTVNGVPIPPKPEEPENCCMSGCVHCVWDDFRDDIESWATRVHEAQIKGQNDRSNGSSKATLQRTEVTDASGSMDDDGGGSEALWTTPTSGQNEEELLFQGIPVGIREFMATEKRIRDRKRSRKEKSIKP